MIINPYRFTSAGTSFLLDDYTGASAAYSFRALSSAFETADIITVRRNLDDASSSFNAEEIADGTMLTWVGTLGTSQGYLATWVDQSGNGENMIQTTLSAQPKIVTNGALVVDGALASVDFDTDEFMSRSGYSGNHADQSVFCVARSDVSGAYRVIIEHANTQAATNREVWTGINNATPAEFGGAVHGAPSNLVFGGDATAQFLGSFIAVDGGSVTSFVDGTQVATDTANTPETATVTTLSLSDTTTNYRWDGTMQEVILFASDQTTNRSGIESNVNAHYSIY